MPDWKTLIFGLLADIAEAKSAATIGKYSSGVKHRPMHANSYIVLIGCLLSISSLATPHDERSYAVPGLHRTRAWVLLLLRLPSERIKEYDSNLIF